MMTLVVLAVLAVLVGGMTLARAVADEALADRILAASREFLATALDPKTAPTPESSRQKTGRKPQH